ncbi:uncharacterized protein MELLADRAFT_36969, partial [Melampsora larici-populina 98AG31]
LILPLILKSKGGTSLSSAAVVDGSRQACADVISGKAHRLIVLVGPYTEEDIDYAKSCLSKVERLPNVVIIMCSYFEKPRTTAGWKGFIHDPDLDGSSNINEGIRKAGELSKTVTDMGMPVGVELFNTISPQFASVLVSWGAVGSESQLHQELASGACHPICFKSRTQGDMQVAINSIRAAARPHSFLGVDDLGFASIFHTSGNPDVNVISRGEKVPNYEAESVKEARDQLSKARPNLHPAIALMEIVDHCHQTKVVNKICEQLINGDQSIVGVMIKSHINEGHQNGPIQGHLAPKPGVSIMFLLHFIPLLLL